MKKKGLARHLVTALAACVALACALVAAAPSTALAVSVPDADHPASLKVTCSRDVGVTGGEFYVWRVATFDTKGDFALDEAYSGFGVDLSQIVSASAWRAAANELAAFIDAQGISHELGGTIPHDGFTSFGNLTPGLYLVRGSGLTNGSVAFDCGSTLVSVPALVDGSWDYDVTCELKVSAADTPEEPAGPSSPEAPSDASDAHGGGSLTGTGDSTSIVPVVACGVIGGALVLLAVLARRRRK